MNLYWLFLSFDSKTSQKSDRWCSWSSPRAWPNSWITMLLCSSFVIPYKLSTIVGSFLSWTFNAARPTIDDDLTFSAVQRRWIVSLAWYNCINIYSMVTRKDYPCMSFCNIIRCPHFQRSPQKRRNILSDRECIEHSWCVVVVILITLSTYYIIMPRGVAARGIR